MIDFIWLEEPDLCSIWHVLVDFLHTCYWRWTVFSWVVFDFPRHAYIWRFNTARRKSGKDTGWKRMLITGVMTCRGMGLKSSVARVRPHLGWKLWNAGVGRRFQAPYNKSISRVSARQMSVLHHIHQRWGLRARRLLARSKDLQKWVQLQLKAAITTGKTISNKKSPRVTNMTEQANITEPVYMETKIKLTLFLKESDYSRDHVICFYLQIRSAVPPQHWCLSTCINTLKESDEWTMNIWRGDFQLFLNAMWLPVDLFSNFHLEPQSGLWAANNDTWSLLRLFLSIPLLLHLGDLSWGNLYNNCTFTECHTFHLSSSAFFYIPSLLGVE